MKANVWIPAVLLLALVAGTAVDRPEPHPTLMVGGYQVLAGDFHVHSGLWSGGTLTPWGLVLEAERQGLDVLAITGHNETWDARVAHIFTRLANGPIVLVGEEVTSPTQDLVAVGIQTTISPYLPLVDQIAEVHRQGGVAIAAHPGIEYHQPYRGGGATGSLDGTEVCHPSIYSQAGRDREYADFAASTRATPIGSSDFHSHGPVGLCRTFLFVREATERGVLEAIREHRTVVYGAGGRAFGDPALVQLADGAGLRARAARYTRSRASVLDWISRAASVAALFGIALVTRSRATRRAGARRGSARRAPMRVP